MNVSIKRFNFLSFDGLRLKEERVRLGLTQPQLAAIGGVGKVTQIKYEKNNGHPDTGYLSAIAEAGIDVIYVLTGQHIEQAGLVLSPYDSEMLGYIRNLPEAERETARNVLRSLSGAAKK
ncbi:MULTISPECIES: helix-turn-helix domain-containing protein [Pseudomonas]|uniref:helix-turn-helix domain-containing protein n=1 Tax=Pseudomonas TaxID=286 RepID=UPI00123ACD86|nr:MULTISPECIES: helix-turn-helix domain-containing protein [Pseudomonas]QEU31520.1 transcriptional regulator [Pseudomonas luteola]